MQDKIVVITGANSGIGLETARALAAQGAKVIMACRSPQRGREALDSVVASTGNQETELMLLDLASFASIRNFAKHLSQRTQHIDVLINNAGLVPVSKQLTDEGYEMQFGVNHLGHFLLTHLLLPQLKAAPAARIINIASTMHHLGKLNFDSFRGEGSYQALQAYAQSKLANVLFTRELAQRLADTPITSYCLHPGGVGTNIAGRGIMRKTLYRVLGGFMSPARGAKTSIYLATEAGIEDQSGAYFNEFLTLKPGSKRSQDMALAKQLWQYSENAIR